MLRKAGITFPNRKQKQITQMPTANAVSTECPITITTLISNLISIISNKKIPILFAYSLFACCIISHIGRQNMTYHAKENRFHPISKRFRYTKLLSRPLKWKYTKNLLQKTVLIESQTHIES